MTNETTQVEDTAQPNLLGIDDVLSEMDEFVEDTGEESGDVPRETSTESADAEESGESAETDKPSEAEETQETKAKDIDSTPESKDGYAPLAALMDEREKRQSAQKEAEELRKRLAEFEKPKERTSILEDEDKAVNELLSEFDQRLLNDRLNMSQALAEREFGKDQVAEKLETFKEIAKDNPDLNVRIRDSALPYHELISIVDQHNEIKQMENIEDYRAKIRAEERAKVEAELKAQQETEQSKRNSISPSLASKRSSGGVKSETSLVEADDVIPE